MPHSARRVPAKKRQPSMTRGVKNNSATTPPPNLASVIRGLYGRVADRLGVDPSYVSRVARSERSSEAIANELRRELNKIIDSFTKKRSATKKTRVTFHANKKTPQA